jgi:hypothetical protein
MLLVFGKLMIEILSSPEPLSDKISQKDRFHARFLSRFYGKVQDRVGLSPTMRVPRSPIAAVSIVEPIMSPPWSAVLAALYFSSPP